MLTDDIMDIAVLGFSIAVAGSIIKGLSEKTSNAKNKINWF